MPTLVSHEIALTHKQAGERYYPNKMLFGGGGAGPLLTATDQQTCVPRLACGFSRGVWCLCDAWYCYAGAPPTVWPIGIYNFEIPHLSKTDKGTWVRTNFDNH